MCTQDSKEWSAKGCGDIRGEIIHWYQRDPGKPGIIPQFELKQYDGWCETSEPRWEHKQRARGAKVVLGLEWQGWENGTRKLPWERNANGLDGRVDQFVEAPENCKPLASPDYVLTLPCKSGVPVRALDLGFSTSGSPATIFVRSFVYWGPFVCFIISLILECKDLWGLTLTFLIFISVMAPRTKSYAYCVLRIFLSKKWF